MTYCCAVFIMMFLRTWPIGDQFPMRQFDHTFQWNVRLDTMVACNVNFDAGPKQGEGAHLFKVHGIVAKERHWITHTACEVCLKEYHSFDKLQAHLRRSTNCRAQMATRPSRPLIQPGIGSRDNNQKESATR